MYIIKTYKTVTGKRPFREWMDSLRDMQAKVAIETRLDRVIEGNFGPCEPVGDGVFELKINLGPGYRVYFGKVGQHIVLLLCAGSKRTQDKDIKTAKIFFEDYKRREHSHENEKKYKK